MNYGARKVVRAVLIGSILLSAVGLGLSYALALGAGSTTYPGIQSTDIADRNNITVISTDSNSWLGNGSEGPRSQAEMVAIAPNGSLLFANTTHTRYWDVDPIDDGSGDPAIEYLYSDHRYDQNCPDFDSKEYWRTNKYASSVSWQTWQRYVSAHADTDACTVNGVTRANLYTGETETVYAAYTPGKHSSRWHDADRINESHLAIADIFLDQVMIVDTRSGSVDWQWNASSEYARQGTGNSPYEDWTHVNDVEVLDDGRLMASLRNQDSVVFLDPTANRSAVLRSNQTLGDLDEYDILNEQHNPDYIPPSRGGPAAIVADSENNRIVEYRRENGSWNRTWEYTDPKLLWPRDADRLSNGHTLITDSNGNRVIEVTKDGDIVWEVSVAFPYEAERLPYDESGGGTATTADVETSPDGVLEQAVLLIKETISGRIFQAVVYVMPAWVGAIELALLVVGAGAAVVLGLLETWWRIRPRIHTLMN